MKKQILFSIFTIFLYSIILSSATAQTLGIYIQIDENPNSKDNVLQTGTSPDYINDADNKIIDYLVNQNQGKFNYIILNGVANIFKQDTISTSFSAGSARHSRALEMCRFMTKIKKAYTDKSYTPPEFGIRGTAGFDPVDSIPRNYKKCYLFENFKKYYYSQTFATQAGVDWQPIKYMHMEDEWYSRYNNTANELSDEGNYYTNFWVTVMNDIRGFANSTYTINSTTYSLNVECYLGHLTTDNITDNQAQANFIDDVCDRILLHYYRPDPSVSSFNYLYDTRYQLFENNSFSTNFLALYSAEYQGFSVNDELFFGDDLRTGTYSLDNVHSNFTTYYNGLPAPATGNPKNNLVGHHWFDYGFMPKCASNKVFAGADRNCYPIELTAKATATATSYSWYKVNGSVEDYITTHQRLQVNPSSTTEYHVYMTSSDGCVDDDYVIVDPVNVMPAVTFTCDGGCTASGGECKTVTLWGADSYDWAPQTGLIGNGATVQLCASSNLSETRTFTYTATESSNGCVNTGTIGITNEGVIVDTESSIYAYIAATTPATCSGGFKDGTAEIIIGGNGSGGATCLWDNGQTSTTATGLTPGIHTVSVKENSWSEPSNYTFYIESADPSYFGSYTVVSSDTWSSGSNDYGINSSAIRSVGNLIINSGVTLVVNNLSLEFGEGAKLILQPNAHLILNGSVLTRFTTCGNTSWEGLEVGAGASLTLNNSSLYLNGSTVNLIDNNGASPATLYFNEGSSLTLQDANTVLEFKGNLHIGNNATFTFSGSGFVRFNMPTPNPWDYTFNVTAGTNASMIFQKNNRNEKALELLQDGFFPPDGLKLFKINRCLVNLQNSSITPRGLNTEIIVTNSTITGSNHHGVRLYGQPNITIQGTIFENGNYGIYAFQTYGGSPLTVQGCTFRNCSIGLKTYDNGATVTSSRFYNNTYGWFAERMTRACSANASVFGGSEANMNETGIYYQGSSSAPLSISGSTVNYNYFDGVQVVGTTFKAKCSSIKYNTENGIYLNHNASLNMSTDGSFDAGKVDAGDNGLTIFADKAGTLYLNNGFNNLLSKHASTAETGICDNHFNNNCRPRDITGTLNIYTKICGMISCHNIYLDAYNNHWNDFSFVNNNPYIIESSSSGSSPLRGFEYDLKTSYKCNNTYKTITLEDYTPQPYEGCSLEQEPTSASILTNCSGCQRINTKDFVNTKLNDAVRISIERMQMPDGDRKAIDMFSQILKSKISKPSDNEYYLLNLAYQRMLEALGNGITTGAIPKSRYTLAPEVETVVDIQNGMIRNCDGINYPQAFYTTIDKGEVYRLADRRDLSLPVFKEAEAIADVSDLSYAQYLTCKTDAERMVLNGELKKEEFQNYVSSCNYTPVKNASRRIHGEEIEAEEQSFKDIAHQQKFELLPNPTNGKGIITYTLMGNSSSEIRIMNLLGELIATYSVSSESNAIEVDLTHLTNGIYFYSLLSGETVVATKKMVVSK